MFNALKSALSRFVDIVAKAPLTEKKLEDILWDFKLMLLESDVAVEVAEQICDQLTQRLVGTLVKRFGGEKEALARQALYETLLDVLKAGGAVSIDEVLREKKAQKEPLVAVFVGINGTGKTTSLAKLAHYILKRGYSVVLACSDTYRAGAIEQLEYHAKRLGVRMIKRPYGSDPASVAYDAVEYAKARGISAVLVDTAGRMETNKNLMEEMRKIARVARSDLTIFVGDLLTGNDAVEQAREFSKYVDLSGSILTKADADTRGGAAISVAYVTKKPILFLGTGPRYEDLVEFVPEEFVKRLLST